MNFMLACVVFLLASVASSSADQPVQLEVSLLVNCGKYANDLTQLATDFITATSRALSVPDSRIQVDNATVFCSSKRSVSQDGNALVFFSFSAATSGGGIATASALAQFYISLVAVQDNSLVAEYATLGSALYAFVPGATTGIVVPASTAVAVQGSTSTTSTTTPASGAANLGAPSQPGGNQSSAPLNVGLIVGVVIGSVCCCFIVVIVGVLLWRRRRNQRGMVHEDTVEVQEKDGKAKGQPMYNERALAKSAAPPPGPASSWQRPAKPAAATVRAEPQLNTTYQASDDISDVVSDIQDIHSPPELNPIYQATDETDGVSDIQEHR